MNLSMSLGSMDAIMRGLLDAPEFTQKVLKVTMTEAVKLVQAEVLDSIPLVTGISAKSITSDIISSPAGVLGVVASSQASVVALELGTRPHMPPVAALEPWVKAVLGISEPKEIKSVAFLVARKIARVGTEPKKPFAKAAASTQAQVLAMFEQAAQQVVDHLGARA